MTDPIPTIEDDPEADAQIRKLVEQILKDAAEVDTSAVERLRRKLREG